jgi:hypothetical protein
MCLKSGTLYPTQRILRLFIFKVFKEQINSDSVVGIVSPPVPTKSVMQAEVQSPVVRPGVPRVPVMYELNSYI